MDELMSKSGYLCGEILHLRHVHLMAADDQVAELVVLLQQMFPDRRPGEPRSLWVPS